MTKFKTTKQEFELISKIADRAVSYAVKQGVVSNPKQESELKRTFLMDIEAVHSNGCPLRLAELLDATPFDFNS